MSERARHLLYVENLVRGVFNAPCGDDEVHSGNYYRALRNEKSAAPLAVVNPHVAASGVLGRCAVSARHIASLYYGHVHDPKFSVASSVLSAAELARIEATRREAAQLATSFEITAGGLNAKDADFFGSEINSLLDAANILRAMGGS